MSFTNQVEWQLYTRGGAEWKFYIRVGWHLVGKCGTSRMSHVLVGEIQISITGLTDCGSSQFQSSYPNDENMKADQHLDQPSERWIYQDALRRYQTGCRAVPAISSSKLLHQNFEVWEGSLGENNRHTHKIRFYSTDAGSQTHIHADLAHWIWCLLEFTLLLLSQVSF